MYSDDAKLIHDLLDENWDLGLNNKPTITYTVDSLVTNARLGTIHIDRLTRTNMTDSVDYQTVTRTSYLAVTVKNPHRDTHYQWCDEVYRILYENRRAGIQRLDGWQTLDIASERPGQDLSGWYSTTFDIKLTRFHAPIRSHGFGSNTNICVPIPLEGENIAQDELDCDRGWTGGEEPPHQEDLDCDKGWTGGEEGPFGPDPCDNDRDLNSSDSEAP